jgi:hypothetical protein
MYERDEAAWKVWSMVGRPDEKTESSFPTS